MALSCRKRFCGTGASSMRRRISLFLSAKGLRAEREKYRGSLASSEKTRAALSHHRKEALAPLRRVAPSLCPKTVADALWRRIPDLPVPVCWPVRVLAPRQNGRSDRARTAPQWRAPAFFPWATPIPREPRKPALRHPPLCSGPARPACGRSPAGCRANLPLSLRSPSRR